MRMHNRRTIAQIEKDAEIKFLKSMLQDIKEEQSILKATLKEQEHENPDAQYHERALPLRRLMFIVMNKLRDLTGDKKYDPDGKAV
jgi:hypothetical protein